MYKFSAFNSPVKFFQSEHENGTKGVTNDHGEKSQKQLPSRL